MDASTQTTHTPGPWEATHRLDAIGKPMQNGRYVILQRGTDKREDFYICEMPFAAVRGGDRREHEANARLIAAAPEILNALREAEDVLLALDHSGHSQSDVLNTVRAAIAKAEGR